jgi:hypothetical protein
MDSIELAIAEIEDYALDRLFGLARIDPRERTFVERRQLRNTEQWLRKNADGAYRDPTVIRVQVSVDG